MPQDECSSAGIGASAGPRVGDPPQTPLHVLQQDVQAHHVHAATAAQGLSGLGDNIERGFAYMFTYVIQQ